MAPPSAATALRESFGDRKLPDISRKISACVACRKAKVGASSKEIFFQNCADCLDQMLHERLEAAMHSL